MIPPYTFPRSPLSTYPQEVLVRDPAPLPDRIKVGPYVYSVDRDERALRDHEHDQRGAYAGFTDHSKGQIHVCPTLEPGHQRATLWHEVKHTVWKVVGGVPDSPSEERVLELTVDTELAVLRDNPALVAFLLDAAE